MNTTSVQKDFKSMLVEEQYREVAKEAWKQHTDETTKLDVLERCRRLNELLSKEFLVPGKKDDILDSIRPPEAKAPPAQTALTQQRGGAARGVRFISAPARAGAAAAAALVNAPRTKPLTAPAKREGLSATRSRQLPASSLINATSRQQAPRHTGSIRQAPAAPSAEGATKRRGDGHRPPSLPSCSPREDDEDDIDGLLGLLNSPGSLGGGGGDDACGLDYRQQLLQQRAAVCIQKHARRMLAKGIVARQREALQLQDAVVCFHAYVQGWASRRLLCCLRLERAAVTLQRQWRAVACRRQAQQLLLLQQQLTLAATVVQRCWRGVQGRREGAVRKEGRLLLAAAAVAVQRAWRCRHARQKLLKLRQARNAAPLPPEVPRTAAAIQPCVPEQNTGPRPAEALPAHEQPLQQPPGEEPPAGGCDPASDGGGQRASPEPRPTSRDKPRCGTSHRTPPRAAAAEAAQQEAMPLPCLPAAASLNPVLLRGTSAVRRLSGNSSTGSAAAAGGGRADEAVEQSRVVAESRQRVQEVREDEALRRSELGKRTIMVGSEHRSTQQAMAVVKRPGGKG